MIQDQEAAAYNETGYLASRPQQQNVQQHINLQEIKERQQVRREDLEAYDRGKNDKWRQDFEHWIFATEFENDI